MQSGDVEATPLSPTSAWLWLIPGCVAAATYVDLAARSWLPGGATLVDLGRCVAVVTLAIGAVAFSSHRRRQAPPRTAILAFSFLYHLIGILGTPVLEDDAYRYLFDGWVFAERGSPYGIAPARFFDSDVLPPKIEVILSGVNNPDIPTVYGPTAQWIFLLAHAISPGEIAVLQLITAGSSFALVCLLARRSRPLPLLFFAWHPLLIKEFAFTAHIDVLAVLLVVIALSLPRRFAPAIGVVLGLAVGAKIFALLIVPAVLRTRIAAWVALGTTLLALYAPFLESMLSAPGGFRAGPLWAMGTAWIFNAPLFILAEPILGPWALRALLAALFVGYWAWWTCGSWRSPDAGWLRADLLFSALLICLPVLNSWYVLWPLVFWVRRPSVWLGVASIAVLLSYATGLNLGDSNLAPYEIPGVVLIVEYAAIGAAAGLEIWRNHQRRRSISLPA
jgi:hypothetical protein